MKYKKLLILVLVLSFVGINLGLLFSQEEKMTEVLSYFFIAQHLQEKGEYEEAEIWYQKVIELNPKIADSYYYLAYIYIQREELEVALEWLNKLNVIENPLAITAAVENLNINQEIKRLQDKIKEKELKDRPPIKKKSFFQRVFGIFSLKKVKKEEKIKGIPTKIVWQGENKIKIYRGSVDNIKEGMLIKIIKEGKIKGVIKIVKAGKFYAEGEAIKLSLNKETLKSQDIIAEEILIENE